MARLRRGRPGAGVCREGGADDCEHRGPTARCGRPGGRDPAQHARLTGPGAAAGKGSGAEVLNVRELILRSDDGPRGCAAVLRELWLLRRMTSAPPPRGTKPSPARSPWLEGLCAAGCVLPHGGAPGGGVQVQQTWRETVDNKGVEGSACPTRQIEQAAWRRRTVAWRIAAWNSVRIGVSIVQYSPPFAGLRLLAPVALFSSSLSVGPLAARAPHRASSPLLRVCACVQVYPPPVRQSYFISSVGSSISSRWTIMRPLPISMESTTRNLVPGNRSTSASLSSP